MSDGAISQDEIDALLAGVDMGGLSSSGSSAPSPEVHIDTSVFGTITANLASKLEQNLATMTGVSVSAGTPVVELVDRDKVLARIPEVVVSVTSDFSAGLHGEHLYLLSPEFAQKLTSLINKEENVEMDDMALSVITEVVSQHTGAEITELSKDGKLPGLACNPGVAASGQKATVSFPASKFVLISYPVTVDGTAYTLWEIIAGSASEQINIAFGGATANNIPQPSSAPAQPSAMGGMQPNMMNMGQPANMNAAGGMAVNPGMMGMNMGMMNNGFVSTPMGMNTPNVQSLQFPGLQSVANTVEQGNIGLIMDVYMEMTVELGRTKKQIKEILGMGEGTIIELDKLAGEPVDILVNHKPIAKGEVVVIDENFGVRVTEILSPIERVTG